MEKGHGEWTGRPLALVLFLFCHKGEKAHQNSLPGVIQCPNRQLEGQWWWAWLVAHWTFAYIGSASLRPCLWMAAAAGWV